MIEQVEVARRGRRPRAGVPGGRLDGDPVRRVRLLRPEEADEGLRRRGTPRGPLQASERRSRPGASTSPPDGLIPKIRKSGISEDVDSLQPHIRAFVERAAVFKTCPACGGSRLNEPARSSKIDGRSIADVCALQVTDAAVWLRGIDDKGVKPLVANLLHLFDSFVEVDWGISGSTAHRARCPVERPSARRWCAISGPR